MIGIGLIGYGGIGRVHALAYGALPFYYGLPADTFQVVGVATSRPETAEKAAREIGCPVWTADYRDLLARDDIHVIDCCAPNNAHEAILIAAAQAGKHLYCEKPLAMNMRDGQRIVTASASVINGLTFNFRYYPAILRAKQLIEDGFLGRVFSFRGRYYRSSYIDASKPTSWRLRKDVSGGGALHDLGSHILDLIYHLLGEAYSVQAVLDTLIKERPVAAGSAEKVPVDVDDIALLHLRLNDAQRTLGLVEISRMGTGATNDLVLEIFGDKGALRFEAANPSWLDIYDARDPDKPTGGTRGFRRVETVQRYDGQKAPDWTMPPDFVRSHAECQYQFLKAVMEGRAATPSFTDGLHIQAIMEAAVRASDAGEWVQVRDVYE